MTRISCYSRRWVAEDHLSCWFFGLSRHEWKIKGIILFSFLVVKWNNLFRIKFDNSQINSNHLGFLYGCGQDISEGARWFIGSFEIIIQRRMLCLWPVLEIACKSIHASVHPSRRYLCNIMNDTEMDKSWPLFQKAHRLVTKKQKGYYPPQVEKCRMVAGIRCFGSGGKDLA